MNQINENSLPSQSIILRYQKLLASGLREDCLEKVSNQEGVRVVSFGSHQGIPVYLLDQTSLMATGSFADLLGCFAVARAMEQGWNILVTSSGGNLGCSLAHYASRAGLKIHVFVPPGGSICSGYQYVATIHETESPKKAAEVFAEQQQQLLGYNPYVPKLHWRFAAFETLGFFLAEYMATHAMGFQWISQTISAGFGPIGMYRGLHRLNPLGPRPRLLCIQQEPNCPAYQRWHRVCGQRSSELLLPKLFDPDPDKSFGTYQTLFALLELSKGTIFTINEDEFEHFVTPKTIKELGRCAINLATQNSTPLHKAGLLALAGIYKAIDQRIIVEGPVLCCLTEGCQKRSC